MTIHFNKKLKTNEYCNFQNVLDDLYQKSLNKKYEFKNLYDIIISDQNIQLAILNIKTIANIHIPGSDKLSLNYYLKMNPLKLKKIIIDKLKNYNQRKIRNITIQNDGENKRIKIPCIIDRIIQMMFLNVLEPICEAKFHNYSYGFRPNRTPEHALANLNIRVNLGKLYQAVSINIDSFFDNIDHGKLIKQIWSLGIRDKRVISIISKMLKNNLIKIDNLSRNKGLSQDNILTPLFSNIVLNELDWWISSQWESFPVTSATPKINSRGAINRGDIYSSLKNSKRSKNMKECYILRYENRFVLLCRKRKDAIRIYYATLDFLKHRLFFNIEFNKSNIINLKKKSLDFLDFKIRTKKQQAGRTNIVVQTNICDKQKEIIKQKIRNAYKSFRKNKNKLDLLGKINKLNSYIVHLHNYFKYATNVTLDFSDINFETSKTLYNRFKNEIKTDGNFRFELNKLKYGRSKLVKWLNGFELIPISYITHRSPMNLKSKINKYTEEGRQLLYKRLPKEIITQLNYMKTHPINSASIEYNINRIETYSKQHGKCAITGKSLYLTDIHCHHIKPKQNGGGDMKENLIILHKDIHRLIHLVNENKIKTTLLELNLTNEQINKINELRKQCELNII